MSVSIELQTLIYQTLVADDGVRALVSDRIYDGSPKGAAFPNITFGPSQELEDDEADIDGEEHFFQIDVWDRSKSRKRGAKIITDAVKVALHRVEVSLPDPYALALIEVTQKRVFIDPDGLTAHGVVMVRALVET